MNIIIITKEGQKASLLFRNINIKRASE